MEATPALPLAWATVAPTADQNSGAVNGTFTTLTFGTTVSSFLNGIIDIPTTSRLRALVAGYYRAIYDLNHWNTGNANNRGLECRLFLNGTTIVSGSQQSSLAFNSAATANILRRNTLIQLAVNDYLEAQVAPLSGTAHTIQAAYSGFSLELVRLL